jgi:hypothetical protein
MIHGISSLLSEIDSKYLELIDEHMYLDIQEFVQASLKDTHAHLLKKKKNSA